MKMPKLIKKHIMQAATRRANARAGEEYDGEPNIRLSSAIAVVLVLHVVAVAGICAFKGLNKHKLPSAPPPLEKKEALPPVAPPVAAVEEPVAPPAVVPQSPAPVETPVKPVAPPVLQKQAEVAKPAEKAPAPSSKDSGKVHTVAKGENPVAIAKKFGVSYAELLKLNKIDDPRKLQIGQKLHIPVKAKP